MQPYTLSIDEAELAPQPKSNCIGVTPDIHDV